MKFIHLADLHLGKNLHGKNLAEDQKHVLQQVLDVVQTQGVDAVLVAGDVYNSTQTSSESMNLLDWFLTELIKLQVDIYAVSGNHDSAEHLSFGSELFKNAGYYLSKPFHGKVETFSRQDEYGKVNFYLLPYITKSQVKRAYPEEQEPKTMDEAMRIVVKYMDVQDGCRNILLAHQFVTGAQKGDSETISIGGLDGINPDTFSKFDYVALGHIHRAQKLTDKIRYPGTLLKYSFNEEKNNNTITVVDMDGEGVCNISTFPVQPLHELYTWKGTFAEMIEKPTTLDYLRIVLTDKDEIVDAYYKLRARFPNLLHFTYKNETIEYKDDNDYSPEQMSPLEHFKQFYQKQNGHAPSAEQLKIVAKYLGGEVEA